MFELGKTVVSEDILVRDFVCNLQACKGGCCVDGKMVLMILTFWTSAAIEQMK